MENQQDQVMSTKKRPRKVLPNDFSGSFSDKSSFYNYMSEQL
jgi:hypothetical protein